MKSFIDHARFGRIAVSVNPRATHIIARWKNGVLHCTLPPYERQASLLGFIESNEARIDALRRPARVYSAGDEISLPGITFTIRRQNHLPDRIVCTPRRPVSAVEVGADLDLNTREVTEAISKMLLRAAHTFSEELLIPKAESIAEQVQASPAGWKIGRGLRVLGSCDPKGIITLSHKLVFHPQRLRDYVVCHELAHLLEMNHSRRFHALCNSYCGNREKQLMAELKRYEWPVIL